ncbi:MAG: hypothetical protein H6905_06685 [Hyphomicrobiales bacterium]|nr:hypothetical protein [Hyphomicrobiales bacterium]
MGAVGPSAAMAALQIGLNAAEQQSAMDARKADAKARAAQISVQQEVSDRERRERLRRALATQRARFGSRGIAQTGSASAVLGGLAAEAARQSGDAASLASARAEIINTGLDNAADQSLLITTRPANRLAMNLLQRNLNSNSLLEG